MIWLYVYSHGHNTERFVERHLLPVLDQGDEAVTTVYLESPGPNLPLKSVSAFRGKSWRRANMHNGTVPKAYLPGKGDMSILVAPVYRAVTEYPSQRVHPRPAREFIEALHTRERHTAGLPTRLNGYVACGNANFGVDAFGGARYPLGPLAGIIDLSGSRHEAELIAERLRKA